VEMGMALRSGGKGEMVSTAEEGDCGSVAGWRGKICWLCAARWCSQWLREMRGFCSVKEKARLLFGLGRML
jgi:hypothetical protein